MRRSFIFLARRGQKSANVLDFLLIELRKGANVFGLLLLTLPRRANVSQSERSRCERPLGFPLRPPRIAIHSHVPFLAVRMYRSPCASKFKNRAFFVDRVAQSSSEIVQNSSTPDFCNRPPAQKTYSDTAPPEKTRSRRPPEGLPPRSCHKVAFFSNSLLVKLVTVGRRRFCMFE